VRDALLRFRLFGVLTVVFFFSAAIALVPLHFLSTMRSAEFISYMGVGRSDVRIDVRQSGESGRRFEDMLSRIAADEDVTRFSVLTTSTFTLHRENGEEEGFAVETGDFTLFPLDYLKGRAPAAEDEIALSYLNSQELDAGTGDRLILSAGGTRRELTVTGVYQDITNGGRTAKATFGHNEESIVARTVNLDLAPGVSKEAKVREYSAALESARVTDLEDYLSQTLGNTISQLSKVTVGALALGVVVAILITSLFFRMLIAKDARRIAIMKSIGFSQASIRVQYLAGALLLLILGIGAGTLFSNTLGQRLVSFLWGFMGAARIDFVIDPLQAYLLVPLVLMAAVAVTTLLTVAGIKDHSITASLAE
jgi:putative ABC transport system permease protein